MGFFSRDSDSGSNRRKSTRAGSETQANELRVRARRRLVGALVLVVAAVIVVPMLIDTGPSHDPLQPIVVPPVASSPGANKATPGNETGTSSITIEQLDIPPPDAAPESGSESGLESKPDQASAAASTETTQQPASEPAENSALVSEDEPDPDSRPKPEETAPAQTPSEAVPTPAAESDKRTDDGSAALALLEGRQPAASQDNADNAAAGGIYVLQIAAYTTEQDANIRRDKLFEAGVTNAFVESATSGGQPTYRLRVGPFPSREAAQAAQTRLRALGYDKGFISSK